MVFNTAFDISIYVKPSDAYGRQSAWSTLDPVMSFRQFSTDPLPKQCWLIVKETLKTRLKWISHYGDAIMGAIASQITSPTIVYSTVYSDVDQRKHQSSRHWPLCGEFTGDRWIPRANGQSRGKCFHLMTSSCLWNTANFYWKNTFQNIVWKLSDILC